MVRRLIITLASPAVLVPPIAVWLLVGLVTYAMPLNTLRLRWMEGSVLRLRHPEDSVLLARYSDLGVLDGNGNHCDFMAGELRRSALSAEHLREHYRAASGAEPVAVYAFDEPEREDNYLPLSVRVRRPGELEVPAEPGVYLVYLYDGMNPPDGDPRCW